MPDRAIPSERVEPGRPQPARGRHPAVAAVASALLLVLAYDPVGAWWLAWVALVPLMLLARSTRRPTRQLLLGAWAGGLVFWLIAVEWVRKSDEGAWPGWLAMALVLSLWWPAFVGLTRIAVRGLGVPLMIAAPAAWVALEFVRAYYPLNGFQWFYLAHSQYQQLWLIQFIDLTGAWGLSFLIALCNAWIAGLLTLPLFQPSPRGPRLSRPMLARSAIFLGLLVASLTYGAARLGSARFEPGPRLALLQTDIPQVFNRPRDGDETLRRFNRLIRQAIDVPAAERPDLIVWPETMFPYPWADFEPGLPEAELERQIRRIHPDGTPAFWRDRQEAVAQILHDWTDQARIPMLVGINSYEFRRTGLGRYNTALLFKPGTRELQSYRKLHLVPFGEYVPLVQTFPQILSLTPFDAEHLPSLDPAPAPSTLTLGDRTLGAVICFEDSVPQVARSVMDTGARPPDVLLNLSNDGWFRGTAAHRLHLANSVFRAVELRVPVARAVNTGISALIDGDGRVLAELREATEGVLPVTVPLDPRTSPYQAAGPWLPWTCLAVSLASLPLAAVRLRQRGRKAGAIGPDAASAPPGDLPPQ